MNALKSFKPSEFEIHQNYIKEIAALKDRINALENENTMLKEELITDPMTRVFNRRFLEKQADGYCIVIDADDFKSVNDTYGHDIGDKVLIELARKLQIHTREGDVVRLGGDEFIITLNHVRDDQKAKSIVNRLQRKIPYVEVENRMGEKVQVGISIGYASNFKKADDAMYEAKRSRKASRYDRIRSNNIIRIPALGAV